MTTGSYVPMEDRSRTSVVHTVPSASEIAVAGEKPPPPLSARSIASDVPEIQDADTVEVVEADDRTHAREPTPKPFEAAASRKDDAKDKRPAAATIAVVEPEPTYSDEFEQSGGAESIKSISTAPSAPQTARSELAVTQATPNAVHSPRIPAAVSSAAASEKIPVAITSSSTGRAETTAAPQQQPDAKPSAIIEIQKPAAPSVTALNERDIKDEMAKLTFRLGDRVIVGGVQYGTVKYIGVPKSAPGLMVGVELDTPEGRHDGRYEGAERYFQCRPSHGIFAPPHRVVLAPKPAQQQQQQQHAEASAVQKGPSGAPAARQPSAAPVVKRELSDAQKKALADAIADQLVGEQIDALATLFASKIPRPTHPTMLTPSPTPAAAGSTGKPATPPSVGVGVPAAPPPTPTLKSAATAAKPQAVATAAPSAAMPSKPATSSLLVLQTPPQPRPPPDLISLASSTVFGRNADATAASQIVLEQASQKLVEMSKQGDKQPSLKETPVQTPAETPQARTPANLPPAAEKPPVAVAATLPPPPAETPPVPTPTPGPPVEKPASPAPTAAPAADKPKSKEEPTPTAKHSETHELPKKPVVPVRKFSSLLFI